MSEVGAGASPQAVEAGRRRRLRLKAARERDKYRRLLITPEGAALRLRIATFAERAGAFTLDFIFQWTFMLVVLFSLAFATREMDLEGQNLAGAFFAVFYFLLRNFYFIWFEMGRKAATPGKRIIGLRVAARDGGALGADAVFARNFMREIEIGLPLSFLIMGGEGVGGWIALFGFLWAGVFMFFPLFNKDKLRVGDIIAGTWVIHAPKEKLQADLSSQARGATHAAFAFTPEQVDAYGIHELHVLENVLRGSQDSVRGEVAARIRSKIGWTAQPGEADLPFLEAYYAALRRRLEQRMLFGERKEDKFDR